jgi:hypothetical protein
MNKDQTASSSMVHSKIIAQVAKEALATLGIFQNGRSRIWIDDHGWWIGVIEFQPSGFSKGSYLNVGAMWLWHEKDYFTFDFGNDVGGRIGHFVEYVDEKQFTPEMIRLASLAKAEVLRLRSEIVSIHDVARYLPGEARRNENRWTELDAAIALGYAGKTSRARWLFDRIERRKPAQEWERLVQEKARGFAETLDRQDDFQRYVKEAIRRTRKLLKLPEKAELDIDREDGDVSHRWKSRLTALRTLIR